MAYLAARSRWLFSSLLQRHGATRGFQMSTSRLASTAVEHGYETLAVTRPQEWVVQVELNRPKKSNAMNRAFWREIRDCFIGLSKDVDCRAVVLSGAGKNFTGGLDLMDFAPIIIAPEEGDVARKAFRNRDLALRMQESFNAIEKCPKPVVAAIHGACVGGGVDMITSCDIRLCSSDAWFQIKEVDIGLAADVGTLQRLPKIVGNDSLVRELVYTARKFSAEEALKLGMVSRVCEDREATIATAISMASTIASKSPVAIQGSKVNIIYSRDHSVPDSLEYAATWNSGMLQTEDVMTAAQADMQKETPVFSKL